MKLWYTNILTQTSLLIIAKKIKGSQSGLNCSFHPSARLSLPSAPSHLTSIKFTPLNNIFHLSLSAHIPITHTKKKKNKLLRQLMKPLGKPGSTQAAFLLGAKALQLQIKMGKEEAKPMNTNKSIFPDWGGSEMQVVLIPAMSGINHGEWGAEKNRWWRGRFEMWRLKWRDFRENRQAKNLAYVKHFI